MATPLVACNYIDFAVLVAPAISWRTDRTVRVPVVSDSRLWRIIDRQNGVTKMASRWLGDEVKINPSKYAHILLPDKFAITFYPRPVLTFGHCRRLRLSVCLLPHWGRVTHICVSKLTIICSDNGLSPGRRQAIIWTNDGILLNPILGTNFSEILRAIHTFSFKKMHLKYRLEKGGHLVSASMC